MRHTLAFGALLLVLPVAADGAHPSGPAAPRFTLLARGRAPEPITLLSIAAGEAGAPGKVVYLDATGEQQTISLNGLVAIAPPSWFPTPETTSGASDEYGTSDLPVHRLDLTDGERFVGDLAFAPAAGAAPGAPKPPADAVYLRHDKLGTLIFPLDKVSRYWSNARRAILPGARPFSGSNDTIVLNDAERLEGLVTRLGPTIAIELVQPGATGKPEVDAKISPGKQAAAPATEIDAGNVATVNLVNPPAPLRTLRVDLADGTVLAAESVAGDAQSGKLTFKALAAGSRGMLVDLGQLAGVVPDPSKLTPLSSLPIAAQKPAEGRIGATQAQILTDAGAPLGAADVLLPGPMSISWPIPAGVTSIIGYAQMDDRSFAWGDCTVVVCVAPRGEGAERELARGRLNATSPSLTISTELGTFKPGDMLRVRTESGERGPIQDRVVLRRMLLLGGTGAN